MGKGLLSYKIGLWMFMSFLLCNYDVGIKVSSCHAYDIIQSLTSRSPPSLLLNQPYRTGYHFQPPSNWMNDPNGPMLYRGVYHLFYQWNPNGAVWGDIVWGHSTSTDLINWTHHPPAMSPSQPADINGCWSGSVTLLPEGKPVILYTGIDDKKRQVQNLAVPVDLSDPYLQEWSKSPKNPLMEPNNINASFFRDPTTAWIGQDGRWRVIVGGLMGQARGLAILYSSEDFVNWVESAEPLYSEEGTGMWECPDFFPVATIGSEGLDTSSSGEATKIKHVLKISLFDDAHDYYTIGTYDRERDAYVPDEGFEQIVWAPRLDYGKFYASKTFFDGDKNRRILWGWVNESSPADYDIQKGWSGLQGFPRKIWLDESGKQLIQWPIEEIERLRAEEVKWSNKVVETGSTLRVHGISASQADVEVSFKVEDLERAEVIEPGWTDPQLICSQQNVSVKSGLGPFGLMVLASKRLEEYTAVYFRIFKTPSNNGAHNKYKVLMCSDQSRSSIDEVNDKTTYGAFVDIDPTYQPLTIRTLIDHSIVESFGGKGKACMTARVYPKMAIGENAHLFVFNKASQSVHVSSLSAWTLMSAHFY